MPKYVITYTLLESKLRQSMCPLLNRAGDHVVLVEAPDMASALQQASPADDCLRMEVVEVNYDRS